MYYFTFGFFMLSTIFFKDPTFQETILFLTFIYDKFDALSLST